MSERYLRSGRMDHDDRPPDLPEHYGPFLRLLVDTAVSDTAMADVERKKLVDLSVEVIDTITAQLTPISGAASVFGWSMNRLRRSS